MLLRNKILISIVGGFCLFVLLMGCLPNAKIAFVDNSYQEVNNQEDIYIIQAYAALDMGDYKTARENLQKAYELTKNKEYLREIIGLLVLEKDFLKAKNAAKDYLKVSPKDEKVRQALVEILGSMGDLQGAVQEVQILLKNNASVQNLEIASSVYFLQKDIYRCNRVFHDSRFSNRWYWFCMHTLYRCFLSYPSGFASSVQCCIPFPAIL